MIRKGLDNRSKKIFIFLLCLFLGECIFCCCKKCGNRNEYFKNSYDKRHSHFSLSYEPGYDSYFIGKHLLINKYTVTIVDIDAGEYVCIINGKRTIIS